MNLNQLAISLIEIDPEDLTGLSELIKEMDAAAVQATGQLKDLLRQACGTAEALATVGPEARRVGFDRLCELLEKVQGLEQQEDRAETRDLASKTAKFAQPDCFALPMELDQDLLAEFITENIEYVNQAEASLLEWEKRPDDKELLNTIFRAFHTIKGTSAFVNLNHIKDLAHQVESTLAGIRDGKAVYSPEVADVTLKALDILKVVLSDLRIAKNGQQISLPGNYHELLMELKALTDARNEKSGPVAGFIKTGEHPGFREWPKTRETGDKVQETALNGNGHNDSSDSTIRVRLDRLDRLLDMVGELVIAQSMVTQDEAVVSGRHYDLAKKVSHAGKIVRELQDLSMYLRMVPLKATFQKLNRLARDLAHKNGKMVNFISEGAETEIDRNMVDLVTDPLIHMIRNSIDHGIEAPEERRKIGKPGDGRLCLLASHSEGNILLQVQDDGRGLNRERIEKKAIERGLMDPFQKLSDQEAWQLIFQPGFTTAEKVTEVSGRGVGLDVVRKAVEELHGRIEIDSVEGQGCIFTLRMPLTMAITDGMVVSVGEEKYILPTANIQIAIRPRPHDIHTVSGRGEMLNFRDQMLPIFRLHHLFEVPGARTDATQGLLIIIGEGLRRCAILVDDLLAQSQVVTKSLGNGLEKVPGISGGAIMGDGRVGLIIDTTALIKFAQEGSSLK